MSSGKEHYRWKIRTMESRDSAAAVVGSGGIASRYLPEGSGSQSSEYSSTHVRKAVPTESSITHWQTR
jgi:hypothetical protein